MLKTHAFMMVRWAVKATQTTTIEQCKALLVRLVVLCFSVVQTMVVRGKLIDAGPDATIKNDPVTFGEFVVVTNVYDT